MERKTENYVFSMVFLAPKDENRQLEDLPQANFGHVPERFLLSVRTKSLTEDFVYWKLRPLFGFVLFQRIFHLEPQCQCSLRFLFRDWRLFYFHSLSRKSYYCVNMINKTIHGCLQIWNFSSRVQLDIWLVRSAHSWAIELNTQREIPYLRTPMYYSLYQLKCILLGLSLCFCNLSKLFQTDVDECQSGLFSCHAQAQCVNTQGSYLVMQGMAFLHVQVGGEQNES